MSEQAAPQMTLEEAAAVFREANEARLSAMHRVDVARLETREAERAYADALRAWDDATAVLAEAANRC